MKISSPVAKSGNSKTGLSGIRQHFHPYQLNFIMLAKPDNRSRCAVLFLTLPEKEEHELSFQTTGGIKRN